MSFGSDIGYALLILGMIVAPHRRRNSIQNHSLSMRGVPFGSDIGYVRLILVAWLVLICVTATDLRSRFRSRFVKRLPLVL